MRLCAAIAVFLFPTVLSANEGVLRGVVKENELGGSTVANVAISALGANPTKSGSYGEFTLIFPSKRPGETILVSVSKADYVVVNDIQLEQSLPADPDAKPLMILICQQSRREEMARRFYHLVSWEAIDANYQKRLKELQATSGEQIALLQKERDQARANADKMAEQLAMAKSGQMSEIYNQALRLFVDGRTEEALKVLNEEVLQRNLVAARKQKEQAEKAIEQAAQSWVLKARLYTLQFRFADADKAYQEVMQAAPESFEVNFAYASFNQNLNRYTVARKGYERCLTMARQHGRDSNIAMTLNNLGMLDRAQNRMEEARRAYDEALKIRRGLAQKNPDMYLPDVATTLNNLGNLDSDQTRMEEARLAYDEALEIYRELAQKNSDTYLHDVAMTLNNLGVLDTEQNRIEEARAAYDEALEIYRELAQKNPDTYLPDVAMTLNNLGVLDRAQKRMAEARQAHDEALTIRRGLSQKNPDTYLPDVAETLSNLGILDHDQKRMDEARQAYDESLKIYRDLAWKNPETYMPYVARTLSNLGNLDRDQKRMDEARQAYDEALEIYQRFATRDPDRFGEDVDWVKGLIAKLPTAN
jgi:tetratricopeptide (TPR) repeat protein